MKRGYRFAGLSLVLAAAIACSSDGPDDGRCDEALTFDVSSGLNPTISWTPDCSVAQLRIIRNSDQSEVWAFVATSNAVVPAVTYGQTPVAATETTPAVTLVLDATYTVSLAVLDPDSGLLLVAGSTEFTPSL